jgi:nucleotide-binding universal stress UspA family protein
VLIAYDGSLQAARALQAFVESGLAADRQLHLAALGRQAQEHARLAAEYVHAHGLTPQLHLELDAGHPAGRIMEIADQVRSGLLVLGCYSQPKLKEFFLGSVTRRVLSETTLPLFLYH